MDREELLKREEEAWRGFATTIEAVPPERRDVEGVVPGWSTHDLVWHCAYWADYAGDVLDRNHAGDPNPDDTYLPDEEIVAQGRAVSWDEAVRRAEQARERVRAALSAFDDPPELAVQWFTDDTFDHYEEHAAQIRAFGS